MSSPLGATQQALARLAGAFPSAVPASELLSVAGDAAPQVLDDLTLLAFSGVVLFLI